MWIDILTSVGMDPTWRDEVRPDKITRDIATLRLEADRGDETIEDLLDWLEVREIDAERITFTDDVMLVEHAHRLRAPTRHRME